MRKRLHAKNKTILHRSIGISRPALERLFERNDYPPQVPGQGWPIAQWQRYADNNIAIWNRRERKNGSNGSHPNPRDAAFISRQKVAEERDRFNLDKERGLYWLREQASGFIRKHYGILSRELEKAFVHELPPRIEGLSANEIAKVCKKRLLEIQNNVRRLLEGE